MKCKSVYLVAAAAVLLPACLLLITFAPSPLPEPKPYLGPLPAASPPPEMAVFAVVTGVNDRVAGFGFRHRFADQRPKLGEIDRSGYDRN